MTNGLQRDVAKLLLEPLEPYGFALSGGLALAELGLTNRPTKDVDLFTLKFDDALFDCAIAEAMAALDKAGYVATLGRKSKSFARIDIEVESEQLSVDLGYDYREYDAVILDIGPVLDKRDAILNKVSALYARMLPRDFIDVYNSIQSGNMTRADILRLSKERDEGFVLEYFANALRRMQALSFEDFSEYGISREMHSAIKTALLSWAEDIEASQDDSDERRP